jgi:hypothetical protein
VGGRKVLRIVVLGVAAFVVMAAITSAGIVIVVLLADVPELLMSNTSLMASVVVDAVELTLKEIVSRRRVGSFT